MAGIAPPASSHAPGEMARCRRHDASMDFLRLRIFDVQDPGRDRCGPDSLWPNFATRRPARQKSPAHDWPAASQGSRSTSLAISPTGNGLATTNSAGRVAAAGSRSRRLANRAIARFPGIRQLSGIFSRRPHAGRRRDLRPTICFWDVTVRERASQVDVSGPDPSGPGT